jgi:hypothetical protein
MLLEVHLVVLTGFEDFRSRPTRFLSLLNCAVGDELRYFARVWRARARGREPGIQRGKNDQGENPSR